MLLWTRTRTLAVSLPYIGLGMAAVELGDNACTRALYDHCKTFAGKGSFFSILFIVGVEPCSSCHMSDIVYRKGHDGFVSKMFVPIQTLMH
jgi:hypothetical protein